MTKIKIEGLAELSTNNVICICGHCGNHDAQNASIELNFREKKIYCLCSQCKKMNELSLAKPVTALPKTRM